MNYPDSYHDTYSKTVFGFWAYLLTDFMMFATLFATYAVLRNSTFGGPSAGDLVSLPFGLILTLLLLTCAFTSALGGALAHRKNINATICLFGVTFLLGLAFTVMEFSWLTHLVWEGNGWQRSAFLSIFFTLIGTHGIHMIFALLWTLLLLILVWRQGITQVILQRLTCLRLFWQFVNLIWMLIFSFVYLMGASSHA